MCFNTEYHVKVSPDDTTKYVTLPTNTLRYTLHDGYNDKSMDVVVRDGRLYDLVDHTDEFDGDLYLDVVSLYQFNDLPNVFQRYITYRASVRAAAQLVTNPQLVQLLQQDEAKARAACMEYECDMGNPSYLGITHNATYVPYSPLQTLRR